MVERPDGREIAKPVELRVMAGDANDNRPTLPTTQYHTVVKELAPWGEAQPSEIQQDAQNRILCFSLEGSKKMCFFPHTNL